MASGGFHQNVDAYTFAGQVCVENEGWTVPANTQSTVTFHGAYFEAGTTVEFGGTPATSVTVVDPQTLSVVTPLLAAGEYEVVVETPSNGTAGITTLGSGPAFVVQ